MIYQNYLQNHVVLKGRKNALDLFLNSTTIINGKRVRHKLKNAYSSNSEDAITWSCFDILSQLSAPKKNTAIDEIIEHAFCEKDMVKKQFLFANETNIKVDIGKTYKGPLIQEETEVDVSIETDTKVIFFEAKLYSSVTLKDNIKPYDQIAKKLRVGLDYSLKHNKEYFFIFLDIAPRDKLYAFSDEEKSKKNAMKHLSKKWKSVWWFNRYKNGWKGSIKPLENILTNITNSKSVIGKVSENMGWLTWTDLFKITLRGMI